MTCADTSFLISLYGDDVNSAAAREHQQCSSQPIQMHSLVRFELTNALRALVFRGKITKSQLLEWLEEMAADQESGLLVGVKIDANEVLDNAETLSAAHTEQGGNRAYDILHVAAARIIGATEFWSFDGKQSALAEAEGLKVGP